MGWVVLSRSAQPQLRAVGVSLAPSLGSNGGARKGLVQGVRKDSDGGSVCGRGLSQEHPCCGRVHPKWRGQGGRASGSDVAVPRPLLPGSSAPPGPSHCVCLAASPRPPRSHSPAPSACCPPSPASGPGRAPTPVHGPRERAPALLSTGKSWGVRRLLPWYPGHSRHSGHLGLPCRVVYRTVYRQVVRVDHRRRLQCCQGFYESSGVCVREWGPGAGPALLSGGAGGGACVPVCGAHQGLLLYLGLFLLFIWFGATCTVLCAQESPLAVLRGPYGGAGD